MIPKHPEHLRHFAALRLEGKTPEEAWSDAIRVMLKDQDFPNYLLYICEDRGRFQFDKNKTGTPKLTFQPVVNTHGKYRRVIVPARTFAPHKKSGDFNWKKVFAARDAIRDHFKRKREEEEQRQSDENSAKQLTQQIETVFGGLPDEVKAHGNQIYVKMPVANPQEAKALLALWKMYQLEKK